MISTDDAPAASTRFAASAIPLKVQNPSPRCRFA